MNKIVVSIIVILIVVFGAYLFWEVYHPFFKPAPAPVPSTESNLGAPPLSPETPAETATPATPATTASTNEAVVTFTDTGYSPSTLTVKKGTIVVFKNESTQSSWTASAKHPTHTVYPTTGGCLGSTFDACKGILPGDSWSFKFDVVGTWGYHDHLHPSFFGKVVVEE